MEEQELHTSNRILFPDKEGFENLFRTYYQDLCSYAFHILKDLAASEEVVQEIFFKLWDKRNELEIHTSLKSYLYQATRNRCFNLIKHIEVREKYKLVNEERRNAQENIEEDSLVESELKDKIRKSIEALPTERKKVFVMSRYEGLKYKEISEKLGISIKTVENQMGKALKFLREELKEYLPLIILGVSLTIKKILNL